MKVLTVLTVAIYATSASLTEEAVSEKWSSFKITYQKSYSNSKEESFRKQLFLEKLKHIEEHNERFRQGLVTYQIGVNKFADMTEEEKRPHAHGLTVPKEYPKPLIEVTSLGSGENIPVPNSLDWRDQGVVTEVKDQLSCGSGWAFSMAKSKVKIDEGANYSISLSEQQLIDCVTDNDGCEGGLVTTACDYIVANSGISSEAAYPYEAVEGQCRHMANESVIQILGCAEMVKGDEAFMVRLLVANGPLSVAIDATGDFSDYTSGVYYNPHCDPFESNHAVLVVGYGSEDGQDFWIVKNSWGENWGDHGYIKMARNRYNNCGIAGR
ncbi:Peptidase C1 and/or Inhibitor I29 domain containing protein, partial [Asbolus verrucosus]